ncbi:carboxypeptidase-like regulatory domain-containing protein [Hymenobacter yonginensis]|uniref:Carboxypeptidase-like regulatory domain-containing protein n=1 Tax=Hymenobacter yonginensis TaxID=748197 RepID=A0ABY7PM79_9BACT|nr:carboxypeptidase-like regulatory domain-containing protein [Hymenobacter yonginensis]WBO84348.1 carboxypeptidase-like regulatory domain-containing protein [Hymenobacter yonginensis]
MFRSATSSNHLTTASGIFRYCAFALVVSFGIVDSSMAASFEKSLNEPTEVVATAVVRGRVLDEVGKPLAGATVLWKGSPYGVTTDSQGNYQLPLAAGHTVVLFSYAGYVNEEVQVRGAGVQNITLLPAESSEPASGVREKKLLRSLR